MKSLEDTPPIHIVPEDVWLHSKDDRKKIINELSEGVVDSFVDFSFNHPKNVCSMMVTW